jgi:hypothetical protein
MNRLAGHPNRSGDLGDLRTSQDHPDGIEAVLDNRQLNQSHPGLPHP